MVSGRRVVDAGGLFLMPGIIDVHTHYDAQVTWDSTLSPSPSAVMGNLRFWHRALAAPGRDLIMRNLAVVEGMDIDALRAGINWELEKFAEYLAAVRRRAPYANLAVFVGHSAVRTAVTGKDASVRKRPTAAELAAMRRLVAEVMKEGAVGLGAYGSQGKAIVSAAFGRPSGEMAERANQPTPRGVARAEGGHMIMGQGAVPIIRNGAVAGACGVGGGTAQQDQDCARAGVAASAQLPSPSSFGRR
jgi:N-acyl-D-aspartate/D-glutamate deacylase